MHRLGLPAGMRQTRRIQQTHKFLTSQKNESASLMGIRAGRLVSSESMRLKSFQLYRQAERVKVTCGGSCCSVKQVDECQSAAFYRTMFGVFHLYPVNGHNVMAHQREQGSQTCPVVNELIWTFY